MQKKFLLIFILVIMLVFSFSISAYASTDYSVKEENYYKLRINFKEKTNLDFPNFESTQNFSSSELYFVIVNYTGSNLYRIAISESPFYATSRTSSSILLKTEDNTPIYAYDLSGSYKEDGSVWNYMGSPMSMIAFSETLSPIIISSDDLYYEGKELLYEKYIKSPIVKTLSSVEEMNVMSEVINVLPVVLIVFITLIGIRKAISFSRKKLRNA